MEVNREEENREETMGKEKLSDHGYKKLKIYQSAHRLAIEIHKMTLSLPKFEMFEEGSQIRRSSKSVSSNIVEGYCLRRYKAEYVHFLFRAYASSVETVEHLELLYKTGSLKADTVFNDFVSNYSEINGMIYKFIETVNRNHKTDIFI